MGRNVVLSFSGSVPRGVGTARRLKRSEGRAHVYRADRCWRVTWRRIAHLPRADRAPSLLSGGHGGPPPLAPAPGLTRPAEPPFPRGSPRPATPHPLPPSPPPTAPPPLPPPAPA